MRKIVLALALLLGFVGPAQATPYRFTVDLFDTGGVSQPAYAFTIDSDPTPAASGDANGFAYFTIADVAIAASPAYAATVPSLTDLLFYADYTGGAFSTPDFVTIAYFGYQLFGGTVDDPTFLTGTTDLFATSGDVVGSVTIAEAAAVPEPAAWALMTIGFGMAGMALRRRSRPQYA